MDLSKYGEVKTCEERDGMFHISIGRGFSNNMKNTWACLKEILDEVGDMFPVVHKQDVDEGKFELVLKQRKQ
jgi:hypothetical protein